MRSFVMMMAVVAGVNIPSANGRAAEATVITLSCDGKLTNARASDEKPEVINKMGLVVNLAERTVSFLGYVVQIDKSDAANISFTGENNVKFGSGGSATDISIHGDIDRVTGAVSIMTYSTALTVDYELMCKPTTRLF